MLQKFREVLTKLSEIKDWQKITLLVTVIFGIFPILFAFGVFDNPRDRVDRLGYVWSSESLEEAIENNDAETVEAFVDGDMLISGRTVVQALRGERDYGDEGEYFMMRSSEVLSALSESDNFAPDSCKSAVESTGYLRNGWPKHVHDNPGLRELVEAVCNGSERDFGYEKAIVEEEIEKEVVKVKADYMKGLCRVSEGGSILCTNGMKESTSILYQHVEKAQSLNRAVCGISSDGECREDGYYEGKIQMAVDNFEATGKQCVSRMKSAFDCTEFYAAMSNPYSAMSSMFSKYETMDVELTRAMDYVRKNRDKISDGNACVYYEQAIEAACEA